jgi:hypothetical protein
MQTEVEAGGQQMTRRHSSFFLMFVVALSAVIFSTPEARAERAIVSEHALATTYCARCAPPPKDPFITPPPDGQIEGPCGLAVSPGGGIYLADYYHRQVDRFAPQGAFAGLISEPGSDPVPGLQNLDAVCGLAFDSQGDLYGAEWHGDLLRLDGGLTDLEQGEITGIAVDPTSDRLFVDRRTYLEEFATPVAPGDAPLARVELPEPQGPADGYGLAAYGGRVYVADAATNTVSVFSAPLGEPVPLAVLDFEFTSLVDASLAVDPTNEHLLVVDNEQPGFAHPQSRVYEFGSPTEEYRLLGALPGAPIFGGPSGIAVTQGGEVLVTDGNDELSNAFAYGPYSDGSSAAVENMAGGEFAARRTPSRSLDLEPLPPVHLGPTAAARHKPLPSRPPHPHRRRREVVQQGSVRVAVQASIAPKRLPRSKAVPIRFSLSSRFIPTNGSEPPQLRGIEVEINRNGQLDPGAVPLCRLEQIQPATTGNALRACRASVVGEGHLHAKVRFAEQSPLPSDGRLIAFNGRWHGHPAILAHVFGPKPVPTSYTIPFTITSIGSGDFGTSLAASLPRFSGRWGYVTSLSLSLGGTSTAPHGGSYLTARCAAPKDLSLAAFPLAHARFEFQGHRPLESTLIRSCRAS